MVDNIINAFGSSANQEQPAPQIEEARTYEINLKSGVTVVESGYLALGGYIAILESPNDSLNIKFATEAGNVDYVQRTDEIVED